MDTYKTREVGSQFEGQKPPSFSGGKGRRKRSWNVKSSNDILPDSEESKNRESSDKLQKTNNVPGQKTSSTKDTSKTINVPGQKTSSAKDTTKTDNVPGQKTSSTKDTSKTNNVPGQKTSSDKDITKTNCVSELSPINDITKTNIVIGHKPSESEDTPKTNASAIKKSSWDIIDATYFVMGLRKTRRDLVLYLYKKVCDNEQLSTPVIDAKVLLNDLKITESNYKKTAGRLVEQKCFTRRGLSAGGTIYSFDHEIYRALEKLSSRI